MKPFDSDGCTLSGASYSKIYAVVKFVIYNAGSDDFDPESTTSGYIGEVECHKPAIFKFLSLGGLILLMLHSTSMILVSWTTNWQDRMFVLLPNQLA